MRYIVEYDVYAPSRGPDVYCKGYKGMTGVITKFNAQREESYEHMGACSSGTIRVHLTLVHSVWSLLATRNVYNIT